MQFAAGHVMLRSATSLLAWACCGVSTNEGGSPSESRPHMHLFIHSAPTPPTSHHTGSSLPSSLPLELTNCRPRMRRAAHKSDPSLLAELAFLLTWQSNDQQQRMNAKVRGKKGSRFFNLGPGAHVGGLAGRQGNFIGSYRVSPRQPSSLSLLHILDATRHEQQ